MRPYGGRRMQVRARVVIIVLALISAGAVLAYNLLSADGYQRIQSLTADVTRLEREKAALQAELTQLQQRLEALKAGGRFRQKIIRDELGYVRDDEVIVDLTKDTKQ